MSLRLKNFVACLTLGLFAFALVPSVSFAQTFKDMPTSHWAYGYVEAGVTNGFFDGTVDNFRPDATLNRAEFAKLVVLVAIKEGVISGIDTTDAPTFTDVPATAWFYQYVATAAKNGILGGYKKADGTPTGKFGPADAVSRAQAATGFNNAAGVPTTTSPAAPFTDLESGAWYVNAVTTAYNQSVIDGYKDADGKLTGKFGPNDPVTRAQIAKIIENARNYTLRSANENTNNANTNAANTNINAITSTGKLDISLSSDTPDGQVIPKNTTVTFLKIKLTAAGEDVLVNSIKITAGGLGTATNIDNVGVYENNVRLGTLKNINSDREAVFNFATPLAVKVGQTVELDIKAQGTTSGNYHFLSIEKKDDITTNTAASNLTGTFPIQGETMQVSDVATAQVTLTSIDTDDVSNVQFGESDRLLAKYTLNNNNVEDVVMYGLSMYNGGTNDDALLSNVRLVCGGTQLATGTLTDKYVHFSFPTGKTIEKNDTLSCEVRGDIGIGTVGNTISLYFRDKTDMDAVGQSYGYGVDFVITPLDSTTEAKTLTLAAGAITMSFDKSATTGVPAQDIQKDRNNVVIAKFVIQSNSENVTIQDITGANFKIEGTGLAAGELENIKMKDVDLNTTYDLSETFVTDHYELDLSDEITLTKGVKKTFEFIADLDSTLDLNDNLRVYLASSAMTVRGDSSDATVTDITPSSITSAYQTVKGITLTVSPVTLANKTVVPSASDVEVYKAQLKTNSVGSAVVKSVVITGTGATIFNKNQISQLTLYIDGKEVKTRSGTYIDAGTITFDSLTANNTIAANTTVDMVVKAAFTGTFPTTGSFTTNIATGNFTAKDVDDKDITIDLGTGNSRTVTLSSSGTVTVDLKTSNAKANRNLYVVGGKSTTDTVGARYLAELVVSTLNESMKITDLTLTDGGTATGSDIESVMLYDSNNVKIAETTVDQANGNAVFTGLNLTVAADTNVSYWVAVKAKGINDGTGANATSGANSVYTISYVKVQGVDTGEVKELTASGASTPAADQYDSVDVSKTATVVGAALTAVTNNKSDTKTTLTGTKTIGEYNLSFETGSNREADNDDLEAQLRQVVVTISKSTNVTITSMDVYLASDSTTTVAVADSAHTCDSAGTSCTVTFAIPANTLTVNTTDRLVIEGTLASDASVTGESLTTELSNLDSDLSWDDSYSSAPYLLGGLTYTKVPGGSLYE